MSKDKKNYQKEYRTMWLTNPSDISEGIEPHIFASFDVNKQCFSKEEFDIFKEYKDEKVYGSTSFINLFCNVFNYSVISIIPFRNGSSSSWYYYITLEKD